MTAPALSTTELDRAAALLVAADRDRAPVAPLSETFPELDLASAYEVQRRFIAERLSGGRSVRGHKVGLTAKVMQDLLGVSEPDFGQLLDDMLFDDGASLARSRYCAPRVEPEIAFRLKDRLTGPDVTVDDVLAATDAVAPSLEIVDSRIADWRITLVDTVADNASSAAMVTGAWVSLSDIGPLDQVAAELIVNGEVVGTGTGDAVLGHPAKAVAWLARTLAPYGVALEPGHLVLPGALTAAPFVSAGDRVTARFSGLGDVSVSFT